MNFDLEAARRGEPIEYDYCGQWEPIRFIGPWTNDSVVCGVPWNYKPEIVPTSKLRMAKKKEVVRYRLYLRMDFAYSQEPRVFAASVDRKDSDYESMGSFIKWIADWQEYEIGANDGQV